MATLYVRNVPAQLYADIQRWAEESGRSVNAEIIDVLARVAERRLRRSDWFDGLLRMRSELELTTEDVDLAIAAIREHRDAGL